MQDGVAALAHHNETGLDCVRLMDDLFRRMTEDDIRFEFNLFLPGAPREAERSCSQSVRARFREPR